MKAVGIGYCIKITRLYAEQNVGAEHSLLLQYNHCRMVYAQCDTKL